MAEEKKGDMQENISTEETVKDIPETEEDILNPDTEEVKEDKGAEDEEDSSEESQEDKTDKKLFKKKQKADKKQDAMKEKIEELEDRVKRQMAEFDNFRKRTEREKSSMFETGAKSVIEKILPVVDNFERGLASIPEEEKGNPFVEGMEMIYKQLMDEFEKMEIRPIPAVGEEFNPEFHNAVMQMESDEYESGIIAKELQRGYTYRESVVRHSMVAVVS
ncbi:MAG: nucleotide exchange factor GrpE [Lachnospiraceae bacterium]|nr:nucleotide exchange factor GrpE [Lachnospiraceae bacterium]